MLFIALLALIPSQARAQAGGAPADPLPPWTDLFVELATFDVLAIPIWRLGVALLIVVFGVAARTYVLDRLLRPLEAVAARTQTEFDDRLLGGSRRPVGWLFNVFALYLAILLLELPVGLAAGLILVVQTFGVIAIAWVLYNAVDALALVLEGFTRATESDMDDHLVPLVRKILRIAIVIATLLTIVNQWGYDVTSLVAGLGLGGLAFALAAQSTLANFFGSIMIFTDRPFRVGDWIKTAHGEGVVEDIGLRSTRVRTFAESLIAVPNADVASGAVENFSLMKRRRIKATVGLTYATTTAQVEFVVHGIRALIERDPAIETDGAHVYFTGFGASSLDILVYCFTTTTAWGEYMGARQRFYLEIMRLVERAGSGFAFPSRSIYFETPLGAFAERSAGGPLEHRVPEEVRAFEAPAAPAPPGGTGYGDAEG